MAKKKEQIDIIVDRLSEALYGKTKTYVRPPMYQFEVEERGKKSIYEISLREAELIAEGIGYDMKMDKEKYQDFFHTILRIELGEAWI